jgi:hypothetical protein
MWSRPCATSAACMVACQAKAVRRALLNLQEIGGKLSMCFLLQCRGFSLNEYPSVGGGGRQRQSISELRRPQLRVIVRDSLERRLLLQKLRYGQELPVMLGTENHVELLVAESTVWICRHQGQLLRVSDPTLQKVEHKCTRLSS